MERYSKEQLNKFSKEELIDLVVKTQNENLLMSERIAVLNQNRFGKKSEKLEYIDEQIKFNEVEETCDPEEEEPVPAEPVESTKPAKKKGKREIDLSKLSHVVVNHELTEEELNLKFGEDGWKKLPDQVYSKVAMHPATYEVIEHHIAVYAAKNEDRIEKAPHPAELLDNSIATASLVAGVMNGKYTNALPLYRIEQEFKRNGIDISRQTMSNWVIKCTERYLSLVYDELHKCLLTNPVIQADETTCTVLNDGRESVQTSYMWLYRTGKFQHKKPIVLYDYQTTRSAEHPIAYLNGFSGYLECDGYGAYHKMDKEIPGITVANCWAHSRRHYANAMKVAKASDKSGSLAATALKKISAIYDEENKVADVPAGKRLKVRKQKIAPLVDEYFNWIKEHQHEVLPQSEVGKGIQYSLNQEKYMRVFLESGDVPIDNSASEVAIRPFTIGRKNWVMVNTINGAKASAIVYSIVETAKANNLNPYEYLNYLLTIIPQHMNDKNTDFIKDLLPWSIELPMICHKVK